MAEAFIRVFAYLIGNSMHPAHDERGERYAD
jgi:hypothetical protein